MMHPLNKDLDHILEKTEPLWHELAGAHLFFTGGTGFFGLWLLESMWWAQQKLKINFNITVLSRSPENFLKEHPHFKQWRNLFFHQGDIVNFIFPQGEFTHILHAAATSAKATFENEDVLKKINNVAEGTRHVLEMAEEKKIKNFWFTSSGSVYGKQPETMALIREDYRGAPETMDYHSSLGQAKRMAEYLGRIYSEKLNMNYKVARCFSFYGPHLPQDIHYAIGNFLRDGLKGNPIQIKGDGKPVRSYLYAADMVVWLMYVFLRGKSNEVYNVGSEESITIADLATKVAGSFHQNLSVKRPHEPKQAPVTAATDYYVPSTIKAQNDLKVKQWIGLEEGLYRTIQFYQGMKHDR